MSTSFNRFSNKNLFEIVFYFCFRCIAKASPGTDCHHIVSSSGKHSASASSPFHRKLVHILLEVIVTFLISVSGPDPGP